MPTRIIVQQDCNLNFIPVANGGGYRQKGYIVDLPEDMPQSLRRFKDRSSFFSYVQTGYIKVEYIVTPEHLVNTGGSSLPDESTVPENMFKRGAKDEGLNKATEGEVEVVEAQRISDKYASVEEVVTPGDPDGAVAPRGENEKYFNELVVDKPESTATVTSVSSIEAVAVTEDEVKEAVAEVETEVAAGDTEYMNGSSVPPEKTEDKPWKEDEVPVPADDTKDDSIEAPTIHMNEPEYKTEDVVTFLIEKGLNNRVAKSAAKILVENITDSKKALALYGVNTSNLNDILALLSEFAKSKER